MIYITGDTHGINDFYKLLSPKLGNLTKQDYLIITGDCGVLFDEIQASSIVNLYSYLPYTVLFVDGNHENFKLLNSIPVSVWNGGKVHKISQSVYHLMRGQVYEIDGISFFTFGGALSFDKNRRIEGENWWKEEMPSENEFREADSNLKKVNYTVDYVISHDCPISWMGGTKSSSKLMYEGYIVSDSNTYLEKIAEKIKFKHWFFGHYHVDVSLLPVATELFQKIVNIEDYRKCALLNGVDYLKDKSPWKKPMKYSGKFVSILGDSISTFEEFNPNKYPIHYAYEIKQLSGVMNVNDTWWMQVIHSLDGKLCENNSYAGSLVSGCRKSSGNNLRRIKSLSNQNSVPDVILVNMGTNDFGKNIPLNNMLKLYSFSFYFDLMIKRLKNAFPKAEIWTIGICSTQHIIKTKRAQGILIEEYNKCIKRIVTNSDSHYVEGIVLEENETHDGLHPNKRGMRKIAQRWIDCMLS